MNLVNLPCPKKQLFRGQTVNKRRKLSVVIPALNEAEAIQRVIYEVPRAELERIDYDVQVLVVDNGSTDGTGELAIGAGAEVLVELERGYGNAYKAGLRRAEGDIILCCDADLTYPLEDVPSLIAQMDAEGLQFVTTNRLVSVEPGAMAFRNRLGNMILTGVTGLLFGFSLKDSQSGMWLIRKELLDQLVLESGGMALSQEIKIKAMRTTKEWREVPIQYRKRVGEVKLNAFRDGIGNLIHLFKLRWQL